MEKLEPIVSRTPVFDARVKSRIDILAEEIDKRTGGGRVQFNIMNWSEIAEVIIPSLTEETKGFDKQNRTDWYSPEYALERMFQEYGWMPFERAIVIAGVQKYAVDQKDGFIPLSPGSIDIEAGVNIEAIYGHKELEIFGQPREPNEPFQKMVESILGFATEYGNGPDSLEIVIPVYTPGIWRVIEDLEYERETGIAVVTPYVTLWCEGMTINKLVEMPVRRTSVKMLEAIKIAKHLCRKLDLK